MNRRGQSAKEAFVGIESAFPRNTPPGVQQNSRRASQKAGGCLGGVHGPEYVGAVARSRRDKRCVNRSPGLTYLRKCRRAPVPEAGGNRPQALRCRVLRQRGSVQRTDTASGLSQNDARRVVVPWTRTQRHKQLCFTRGHGAQLQCHTPHAAHPADSSRQALQAQRAGGAPAKKCAERPVS